MEIVDIFNQIRDLPYKIPITSKEEDFCCSGKTISLKNILEKKGYRVRYRVCSFSWNSIDLPSEVLKISHENLSTHVYLEILIDNKWIIMDATWDPKLKKFFHINDWNNKDNNQIAVEPIETFTIEKSLDIMEKTDEKEIVDDLKINGEFYQAFNNWLEEVRVTKLCNN
ncbi:MAG: hypothetical protein WCT51_04830 [Candidatus Shapirobacteria bacterium]|jgi:hypothetical protein